MSGTGPNRRLSAVLIADIAGYTKLVEQDTDGTVAAWTSAREGVIDPEIGNRAGRIVKYTGDGFLAEFPNVQDAVECAIAMQAGLADSPLDFRMGVNLGNIVDDGTDIHGEGVNIAARIEALASPGGISVSGSVYEQIRNRVEAKFEDIGEHEVKHVSAPVRVYRIGASVAADLETSTRLALPEKPSIAVLPFDNLSADPEQEFFVDGMTEDIITELSRFESLFVIARNSAFVYKNKQVDVRTVAEELGVHYLLEGSVRKAGDRVRITAQLVNGEDASHVWAERYDGVLEDVFALQEQVTSQVVASIAPQIAAAQQIRAGEGAALFDEAQELAYRALFTMRSAFHQSDQAMLERAIGMALESVAKNGKCGSAYLTLCTSYAMKNLLQWGDDPSRSADLSAEWADKFVAELPGSYRAYRCRGLASFRKGKFSEANRDYRYAHELNPNDTATLQQWSWCEASAGIVEDAKRHAELAIRLNPKDPVIGIAFLALAMVAFIKQDNMAFEDWGNKAIQAHSNAPIRRAMMIAHAANTGDQELLETHRTHLMEIAPGFIGSLFRGENRVFERAEHMELLLNGLRKAGFDG